jgi:putative membrane protein
MSMGLLLVWALNAVALLLVPYVIPGVHIENFYSALVAVLVLGLVNTVVRPIFVLLTLPVTLLTLGLFLFVVNALMFWFVGDILSGFRVDGFVSALFGSIVYSVASWLFSSMIQRKKN